MAAPARTITIVVNDASDASITLNYGQLTGGDWEDNTQPVPGTTISPGQNTFVNGADNAFESLGGLILLTPASGGTITVTWSWPRGSGVTGTTTGNSLNGLAVTSSVINTQSMNPQMQVYITDSASLAATFGAASTK
jgi:hypothetical protein